MLREIDILAYTNLQSSVFWSLYLGDRPDLSLFCQSVDLPFYSLEYEAKLSGKKTLTGFKQPDTVSMTFLETEDGRVFKFFNDWRKDIFDPLYQRFKTGNHKKDAVLMYYTKPINVANLLTSAGGQATNRTGAGRQGLNLFSALATTEVKVPSKKFVLEGLMPQTIETIQHNYTTSESRTLSITFSIEDAYLLTLI